MKLIRRTKMVLFSLTFVRHGETMYNRKNIIQGQMDVPLSELGERQASLVADRLQYERFTHIYASDLARAHDTAKFIADANRVCKCDITVDKRLRERKFGTAEGKSSKDLLLSAKKAKKKYKDYTPPGAETVEQVQERVESFFKDLCKICINYSEMDESLYTPAKIKRRHGGSLGRNSGPNKRLELSRRSQSFCGSGNIQNIINEMNTSPDFENEDDLNDNNSFCQHNTPSSMQDCDCSEKATIEEYSYRECFPSGSDDSNLSSDLKSYSSSNISDTSSQTGSEDLSQNINGNVSDSTVTDKVPCSVPSNIHDHHDVQTETAIQTPVFRSPTPVKPVSRDINSTNNGCPNVSLSPNMQQRLTSISSISSGRNSSFDDSDSMPTNVADILVVSHGGYIKEMVKYFVETLDCNIPGVKGHAFKVCPNCSLSKFTISLDEKTEEPSLTCITIHDKDHLIDLDLPLAKGLF